jgi:hypothetical protein
MVSVGERDYLFALIFFVAGADTGMIVWAEM